MSEFYTIRVSVERPDGRKNAAARRVSVLEVEQAAPYVFSLADVIEATAKSVSETIDPGRWPADELLERLRQRPCEHVCGVCSEYRRQIMAQQQQTL